MTVQIGLETLLKEQRAVIAGQRLGLIAAAASVDAQLVNSIERLHAEPGIRLTALYGPEHGVRGAAQAGEHVTTQRDPVTGLPAYSLYGATVKPDADMLAEVDTLLYDLQDGGLRFFTFLSTLVYVLQAAAEHGKRVIVLDRPVFLGGEVVEGNLLQPGYESMVGVSPLPIRYGMTAGEIALMLNTTQNIGCDLTVVPMRGWTRSLWFDQTGLPFVPPSPNLPTLTAFNAYPGTCLIEGTTLSEGRGTTKPFEYMGAPFVDAHRLAQALNALDLPGVRFRPVYFVPTFSKWQGQTCGGVHLYITERRTFEPVATALHVIATARTLYPEQAGWRDPWSAGGLLPIDLLTGGAQVRQHFDAQRPVRELLESWQADLAAFAEQRQPFLLYAK